MLTFVFVLLLEDDLNPVDRLYPGSDEAAAAAAAAAGDDDDDAEDVQ